MGWTGHGLENGWSLFTRGGLEGIFISNNKDGDEEINVEIPEELLVRLAADGIRSNKISQLEDMNDKDLFYNVGKIC